MVTPIALRFVKGIGLVVLLGGFLHPAYGQDIPFDPTVPETAAGAGDQAPPPPPPAAAPQDNAAPGTEAPPPPPAAMPPQAPTTSAELNGTPPPEAGQVAAPPAGARARRQVPADLSGLGKLAPFSDIAVITKRYLPKTHRFEFYPNVGLIMNDAFFSDLVIGGRLGFYFNENWGVEASAMTINTNQKSVTKELQAPQPGGYGINTNSLSSPSSYFGADVKWDPIYGKVAFVDKTIIPFDFYFTAGGGVTGISGASGAPTIHLGAGQLFAIEKWMAFRWDISWYGYTANSITSGSSGTFTNLHATIGMSFFFPGAEYR